VVDEVKDLPLQPNEEEAEVEEEVREDEDLQTIEEEEEVGFGRI